MWIQSKAVIFSFCFFSAEAICQEVYFASKEALPASFNKRFSFYVAGYFHDLPICIMHYGSHHRISISTALPFVSSIEDFGTRIVKCVATDNPDDDGCKGDDRDDTCAKVKIYSLSHVRRLLLLRAGVEMILITWYEGCPRYTRCLISFKI